MASPIRRKKKIRVAIDRAAPFKEKLILSAAQQKKIFQSLFAMLQEPGKNSDLWLSEWTKTLDLLGAESVAVSVSVSVSVTVCEDAFIRSLNKKYRGLDRATDVLSFADAEIPDLKKIRPPGMPIELGSIVISQPAVLRGAERARCRPEVEWLRVLIHGTLHLLGFDHVKTKNQAQRMRRAEKALFLALEAIIKS